MGKEKNEKKGRPRCPTCDSRNILHLRRTKEYWCRRCGETWKKEEN